jgi:hypothetical protein
MCTVLAAVEFGLREGREPDDGEIWKITSQERKADQNSLRF